MIYIDELLEAMVANVSTELGFPVYFKHGHPLEIVEILQELSLSPTKKNQTYPLVALFRDFPEDKGKQAGIYSEATLNIIIATLTQPTFDSNDRKNVSFKPTIDPIWEALERQIELSNVFFTDGVGLDYRQIDHYFWGRESLYGSTANIFNDWIDCKEIKNLNLKTLIPKC